MINVEKSLAVALIFEFGHLNGQHSSLDLPPNNPLFSKAPKKESLADALTSAATAVVGLIRGDTPTGAVAMSPGKRARVSRL